MERGDQSTTLERIQSRREIFQFAQIHVYCAANSWPKKHHRADCDVNSDYPRSHSLFKLEVRDGNCANKNKKIIILLSFFFFNSERCFIQSFTRQPLFSSSFLSLGPLSPLLLWATFVASDRRCIFQSLLIPGDDRLLELFNLNDLFRVRRKSLLPFFPQFLHASLLFLLSSFLDVKMFSKHISQTNHLFVRISVIF